MTCFAPHLLNDRGAGLPLRNSRRIDIYAPDLIWRCIDPNHVVHRAHATIMACLVLDEPARLVFCITLVQGLSGFGSRRESGREMYTIKRVSEMVGVPVATLRAWQRRYGVVNPERSNSGYRLYQTRDIAVLRRMQSLVASGWSPKEAAAAVSGETDPETDPRIVRRIELPATAAALPTATAVEDLVTAAIDLDPLAASRLLDEHFATGSFEYAVDAWLLPELERLGAAWANGDVTVAGEHIVAAAVQRRLSAAFDAAAMDSERFPFLLTGLPAGCHHELGILAYATAARRRGMAVLHLGPDLPVRDWLVAVQRHQPDAVVLAVPTAADIQPAAELIKGFAARHVLIAVGGRYQDDAVSAANVSDDQWVVALGHSIGSGAAKLRDRLKPPRG